jgi:hypothetical protein
MMGKERARQGPKQQSITKESCSAKVSNNSGNSPISVIASIHWKGHMAKFTVRQEAAKYFYENRITKAMIVTYPERGLIVIKAIGNWEFKEIFEKGEEIMKVVK